jgi:hypothetical protein
MRDVRPRPRLTVYGRWLVVQRVEREGWTVAATAEAAGVSRLTVYRWLRRWEAEREAGLQDRSSRPWRSPRRVPGESRGHDLPAASGAQAGPAPAGGPDRASSVHLLRGAASVRAGAAGLPGPSYGAG